MTVHTAGGRTGSDVGDDGAICILGTREVHPHPLGNWAPPGAWHGAGEGLGKSWHLPCFWHFPWGEGGCPMAVPSCPPATGPVVCVPHCSTGASSVLGAGAHRNAVAPGAQCCHLPPQGLPRRGQSTRQASPLRPSVSLHGTTPGPVYECKRLLKACTAGRGTENSSKESPTRAAPRVPLSWLLCPQASLPYRLHHLLSTPPAIYTTCRLHHLTSHPALPQGVPHSLQDPSPQV